MVRVKRVAFFVCLALLLSLFLSFTVTAAHDCDGHIPQPHDCAGAECVCHTATHTCSVCLQASGLIRIFSFLLLTLCAIYAVSRAVSSRAFSLCRDAKWALRTPVALRCKLTD